jgi:hypothetical protein
MLFGFAVVAAAMGITASALRNAGLMGGGNPWESSEENIQEEEPINDRGQRQSYADYVQERLSVEKWMRK